MYKIKRNLTRHSNLSTTNNNNSALKKSSSHTKKQESYHFIIKANEQLHQSETNDEYLRDFVCCIIEPDYNFNLPRISAALERLMGTNVVRLTDRNYMKELRERIEDDYRQQLQKRIRARELKELERERLLIIEGRTDVIPPELSEDPIFVVNKKANVEIRKARSKLKTNREKNSERLKLQGVKWERERLQHEEEEKERIEFMRQRYKQQRALEEKFKEEDEEAGMDLLRIFNEEWRPCERDLKRFLAEERARMKERSLRVSTPFSSDPKDMHNVIRAKKQQAKAEKEKQAKIRKGMLTRSQENLLSTVMDLNWQQLNLAMKQGDETGQPTSHKEVGQIASAFGMEVDDMEEDDKEQQNLVSDDASSMSSGESFEEGSTISMAKQRYALMLQQELENDVAAGLLISKEQYDHLRYEDEKIMQLRNASDIRELYQLAEEVIIGDRMESAVEEEAEEEEVVEEEFLEDLI